MDISSGTVPFMCYLKVQIVQTFLLIITVYIYTVNVLTYCVVIVSPDWAHLTICISIEFILRNHYWTET